MIEIVIFSWVLALIIGMYIAYRKIKNQNKDEQRIKHSRQ